MSLFVVPSERLPSSGTWESAGVVGGFYQYLPASLSPLGVDGINARTVIGANVVDYGAVGDGITDCTQAYIDAQSACPLGQVLYSPEGDFRITDQISLKAGITWRGAGPGLTRILLDGNAKLYTNADFPTPTPSVVVTSGATKGSTVLTCSSTAAVVVGKQVTLTQLNPDYVHFNSNNYGDGPTDDGHGSDRLMALTFMVATKDSSTVTLDHPLPIDMTDTPRLTPWAQYVFAGAGFENMTIDGLDSTQPGAFQMFQSDNCWWYKVNFTNLYRRSVWLNTATNCTVEHCDASGTHAVGAGANTEGLDLYFNACFCLIQNCWMDNAGYPMALTGDWGGGCSCNVFAYNYLVNETGATTGPYAFSNNHGPHNMFNLWEGNFAQNIASDGYYGSDSRILLVRNCFSGQYDRAIYQDESAIMLCHWATDYTIIGNILGVSGYSAVYEASGSSFQDGVIFRFGYPNPGNRAGWSDQQSNPTDPDAYDTNVKATAILNANFDYVNNAQVFSSANHDIQDSYYLSETPAWFGPLAWPPFDPTNPGAASASSIPAGYRFINGHDPVGSLTLNIGTLNAVSIALG